MRHHLEFLIHGKLLNGIVWFFSLLMVYVNTNAHALKVCESKLFTRLNFAI